MYILNKSVLKKVLIYSLIVLPVLCIGFVLGASFIEYDISTRRVEAQEVDLDTGFSASEYAIPLALVTDITRAIEYKDVIFRTTYASDSDLTNYFLVSSVSTTLSAYSVLEDWVKPKELKDSVKLSKTYRSNIDNIHKLDYTIFSSRVKALKQVIGISSERATELGKLFLASKDSTIKVRPSLTGNDLKDISRILKYASEIRSLYSDFATTYKMAVYSSSMREHDLSRNTVLAFEYSYRPLIKRFEKVFDAFLLCRDVHEFKPGQPCI